MAERAEVPNEIVVRLRSICLALPEAYEEQAWVGTRWMVRKKNFAHVVQIDAGWPPAYARAVGADGPLTVLTFRSSGAELEALAASGPPYFKPVWFPDIVGLVLDGPGPAERTVGTDWNEVGELLAESFCTLAPKQLAERVYRPSD